MANRSLTVISYRNGKHIKHAESRPPSLGAQPQWPFCRKTKKAQNLQCWVAVLWDARSAWRANRNPKDYARFIVLTVHTICMGHLNKEPLEPEENTIGTAQLWDRLLAWGARALESLSLSHGGLRNQRCLSSALRRRIYFWLFSTSGMSNHFTGFFDLFLTSWKQSFVSCCIQHDCWARGVEISVCLHRRFCDSVRHVLYVYVGAKQGAFWVRFECALVLWRSLEGC